MTTNNRQMCVVSPRLIIMFTFGIGTQWKGFSMEGRIIVQRASHVIVTLSSFFLGTSWKFIS